jgi:hypothetical protein
VPLFLYKNGGKVTMHYELGEADNHVRWCFSRLRFMSSILKDKIRKDGIWEDFTQELYATSVMAWQQNMDIGETRRYARRQIHAFFKEYGYKSYRNTYVKMEQSFSGVFADWQVNNLDAPEMPANNFMRKDTVGDNYLQEQIVNILKRKVEGLTRADLSMYLQVPVHELQWHLDSLLKGNRIVQVKRESYEGTPPTPLFFIAGAKLPEQKMVKTEMYENIRRLYFSEGKTMEGIAKECHHSLHTICKAIHSPPVSMPQDLVSV